jgi:hypothetical protein
VGVGVDADLKFCAFNWRLHMCIFV